MRSPHNAVSDTIAELNMTDSVRETVRQEGDYIWIVRFESIPTALIRSFLEVEIIEEDDGDASVCVLRRFNVGRRVMARIMDTLVEHLDDVPRLVQPFVIRRARAEPASQQE